MCCLRSIVIYIFVDLGLDGLCFFIYIHVCVVFDYVYIIIGPWTLLWTMDVIMDIVMDYGLYIIIFIYAWFDDIFGGYMSMH